MSTSFQFPFSIASNMCNIVQHGEQFELRINNQVFAHLYDQRIIVPIYCNPSEKMRREFQYEDGGNYSSKDDYSSTNKYKDDTYGGKSSYQGYGSDSYYSKKDDYGSKKDDYGSYPKSYGGYPEIDYGRKEHSPKASNSRNRGWEDVKKAQREYLNPFHYFTSSRVRKDYQGSHGGNYGSNKEEKDEGLGFDHGFGKFDYASSNK